jgi:hypothetical protein
MITPMQFIYEAAKKTPKVITPSGKEIFYEFLETPECKDKKCWLCGGETNGKGTSKKKTIKPTFTNHDIAKYPLSESICEACTWGLSNSSLRNYSILATEKGLQHPSKLQIREYLMNPPKPPFVFTIAVSGQKWLHILARINYNAGMFYVMYEQTPVQVRPLLFRQLIELIEKLYNGGFTKDEILKGDYQTHKIQTFGIEEFEGIEWQLEIHRGSRLFELAVDMAKKEE